MMFQNIYIIYEYIFIYIFIYLFIYLYIYFLKVTEMKYQMKTKFLLISKEQKTDIKKEEDVDTRRIRQKLSFIGSTANRKGKSS